MSEPGSDSGESAATEAVGQPEEVTAPSVTPAETPPAAPTAAAVTPAPVAEATSPAADEPAGRTARKVREGTVVSDKMQSTVVVAVIERVRHARYGKTVQRTKKLYAHDDSFEARIGDRVRITETRPVSKLKRWRVTEVVERAR
jgi:small subunit ribosomal protein S17